MEENLKSINIPHAHGTLNLVKSEVVGFYLQFSEDEMNHILIIDCKTKTYKLFGKRMVFDISDSYNKLLIAFR